MQRGKNWGKKTKLAKFPVIPARISEIPGNSRREFWGSAIPENSRSGIPGGLAPHAHVGNGLSTSSDIDSIVTHTAHTYVCHESAE